MGSSSRRKSSSRDESFGFKTSSGVDYSQLSDRQIEDERFERQRALRAGTVAAPVPVAVKPGVQSATMDAFMRLMTGKEERTIADRIADPNRPTWEQYKRENADKLDLSGNGEKEMLEYRKKLDAAREKRKSRHKKRSHKRRRSPSTSGSDDDSGTSGPSSDESDGESRRSARKHKKKSKKSHKKKHKRSSREEKKDRSPSPVRLSSFFQRGSDDDSD
ncbi:hypothetical protein ATCC90586_005206 [Pythium insidiosum]|nr:hypothetical protein ATCC90586_005206 [Pythium insidiosum]